MDSLRDIGEQIAHTRRVRRLSVRRLAAEAGVSPAWLAALEKAEIAEPSLPRVVRVLNALDLDLRVRNYHGGIPDLDEMNEVNDRERAEIRAMGMSTARFR